MSNFTDPWSLTRGGLELRSGECHDVVSLNEFFEVSISCSFGGG